MPTLDTSPNISQTRRDALDRAMTLFRKYLLNHIKYEHYYTYDDESGDEIDTMDDLEGLDALLYIDSELETDIQTFINAVKPYGSWQWDRRYAYSERYTDPLAEIEAVLRMDLPYAFWEESDYTELTLINLFHRIRNVGKVVYDKDADKERFW